MACQEDFIKTIEFITMYPGENEYTVFIAIAKTELNHRILIYAPRTLVPDLSCEQAAEFFEEATDVHNTPIQVLYKKNKLRLNGQIYMFHDEHNGGDWFLKTIYLDGPRNNLTVNKEEVEKLFGCKING